MDIVLTFQVYSDDIMDILHYLFTLNKTHWVYVCVISTITVVRGLVHRLHRDAPQGLHVTFKVRSNIMRHVVCSDRILFFSQSCVCKW